MMKIIAMCLMLCTGCATRQVYIDHQEFTTDASIPIHDESYYQMWVDHPKAMSMASVWDVLMMSAAYMLAEEITND